MIIKIQQFIFCFILIVLTACSIAGAKDSQEGEFEHLCPKGSPYTEYEAGVFIVRVYEPNSLQQPDIWQGPVCVINSKSGKKCGFDLSLIKGVKVAKDKKYIEIGVFSGSNAKGYIVELESCDIKLR